ncbi:TetR/AcrR family transcriptional regulator [Azospirillum melinis]|nr:TetR/AcrR family transcriptional regulator [Azospirillum melinis]MBP2310236.1 AcrR family transcriptional regulator [Azospirillum melinis]
MRRKTETKRDAILNAATLEFTERGYEGASISAIVGRLGASKQTLYRYFPSKDELFVEVMARIIDRHVTTPREDLEDTADVPGSLQRHGERYLKIRLSPEMVSLARLVFGESGRSDVSRLLHPRGKLKVAKDIGRFLTAAMEEGRLRVADPAVAALHYLALLDAELFEPVVLRVREPAANDEIAAAVDRAVDAFLAGYGREGKHA